MTTDAETGRDDAPPAQRRDRWRHEMAELLELAPATVTDDAHLVDKLGLDSLALMTLRAWMDTKGVSVADPQALQRVGDVLTLLERLPAGNRVSFVVVGAEAGRDPAAFHRATDVPNLPPPTPQPSPLTPVLDNHTYQLTPVTDADIGFLYTLATHPETSYRWRYRGAPPPPERFAAELWGHVLVQYVARHRAASEPAGLVVAYAPDLVHGHAHLGAVFWPEHTGTGLAADITALFVRYLFHTFPLRKLYLEVPGFNWPQLRSAAGRLFQIEGVLRDHDYYAGRYWDQYLCAIYPPGREPGTGEPPEPPGSPG